MSKDSGGPAFPVPGLQNDEDFNGMSLRDYFAAQAMQGMLSNGAENFTRKEGETPGQTIARQSYMMADMMIERRSMQ